MTNTCLDIGVIQAFLDGELSHNESSRVSGHIAICDACAHALADAEDESAIVFPALAREFDAMVPTQRLWSRINDSIEAERRSAPLWKKAAAFLTLGMRMPALAAAASLLLVVGVVATLVIDRTASDRRSLAASGPGPVAVSKPVPPAPTAALTEEPGLSQSVSVTNPRDIAPAASHADYRPSMKHIEAADEAKTATVSAPNADIAGQETYVSTIATLTRSVDGQKDSTLRPSERIAYERDMAVVDDSIKRMQDVVKKDPRNRSARQVLYSSYQNKIDLLNSVSQKEELVASLK